MQKWIPIDSAKLQITSITAYIVLIKRCSTILPILHDLHEHIFFSAFQTLLFHLPKYHRFAAEFLFDLRNR